VCIPANTDATLTNVKAYDNNKPVPKPLKPGVTAGVCIRAYQKMHNTVVMLPPKPRVITPEEKHASSYFMSLCERIDQIKKAMRTQSSAIAAVQLHERLRQAEMLKAAALRDLQRIRAGEGDAGYIPRI